MNITRFTDYSLRTLIYLALTTDRVVTIKAIAERYQISKNHLMKIVQQLNNLGFLQATRGKNGGLKLSQPPEQINIGNLVRILEQDAKLVECFGSDNRCLITPACQLKHIFAEAIEQFYRALEQYTLADLVNNKNQKKLNNLLAIDVSQIKESRP